MDRGQRQSQNFMNETINDSCGITASDCDVHVVSFDLHWIFYDKFDWQSAIWVDYKRIIMSAGAARTTK